MGKFSLIKRLLTSGSFFITKVAQILCYFFHGNSYAFILKKIAWATFWVIVSKTHLVTLLNLCYDIFQSLDILCYILLCIPFFCKLFFTSVLWLVHGFIFHLLT
jgi:hypothetical protein